MPTLNLAPPIMLPATPGRGIFPARGQTRGPALPLQGLTLLVVEDSRFASDALRLMSQRSGARMRRADTIAAARAHLRVYRPDVVLIDLGLPDGRGEDLIRDLAHQGSTPVLAMSGDACGRSSSLAAGAAAFLEKPIAGLAAFQSAILALLGGQSDAAVGPDAPAPDPMALIDDLRQAAIWLATPQVRAAPGYLIGFVAGIARHAGDASLVDAARDAGSSPAGLEHLSRLIADRLGKAGVNTGSLAAR